jgi:hypothetical protein
VKLFFLPIEELQLFSDRDCDANDGREFSGQRLLPNDVQREGSRGALRMRHSGGSADIGNAALFLKNNELTIFILLCFF